MLTTINHLNETALELIKEENYKEAFDYFGKAEDHLQEDYIDLIPEPYLTTIYYNIAFLNQKLGRLKECGQYLNKALHFLELYCEKSNYKSPNLNP